MIWKAFSHPHVPVLVDLYWKKKKKNFSISDLQVKSLWLHPKSLTTHHTVLSRCLVRKYSRDAIKHLSNMVDVKWICWSILSCFRGCNGSQISQFRLSYTVLYLHTHMIRHNRHDSSKQQCGVGLGLNYLQNALGFDVATSLCSHHHGNEMVLSK